ncbi:HD-GYP domain-containing protein [Thermospira aquatica]|uniref:HD-GYP domain-containing protein n=1 Tax=Thermospira aquatica TaxID=2828656 RepID=A0AAX3BET8_9SPIR|nr:HD-GYP domain-containing protein [Thermospira aquatica]URA10746.1 HD-GYP domain-containing protein [Thermospira aquatica]
MPEMRRIPLSDLRPGMIFDKSLFDSNYNIILPARKPLDRATIGMLYNRGITEVSTAGELVEVVDESKIHPKKHPTQTETDAQKKVIIDKDAAKHIEFYKNAVTKINNLYQRYKKGESLDINQLQQLAHEFVNTIMAEKKVEVWINLINAAGRGDYLSLHIINTTILALLLGKKLGYSAVKLINLTMAALLFDIGMLKIPAYIVEKEEKLTPEEFNQIKTHPIHSYQIIARELSLPVEIARVGLEHHERFDGTGYPRHLKGQEISEMSRIMAIVDTYEALTKKRSYREKKESYDAMRLILGEGSRKFDPEILKVFLSLMSVYPVGSYVQLNNKCIARVVASDSVSPFRPTVKIVRDEFGDTVEDGEIIRLAKETDLYIVKVVYSSEIQSENNASLS